MKNVFTCLVALLFFNLPAHAQVPKKVIVEHFTNTVCSICASKNPGFYTNLKNQQGVIHLAVHPSSPYTSCILNKHNVSENDARTNYYGVYGATPRLAIQGVVIASNANYSSAAIFTPYLGKTSPASIKIYQRKFGTDSIRTKIVVKTEATHALSNLKLCVFLAEDTIFYTSPNGETKHFDVFRKSLTGITGVSITLPATVGDSVIIIKSSPANTAWNFSRIYTLAILQDGTSKAIVQCESVPAKKNDIATGIDMGSIDNTSVDVFLANHAISIKQNVVAEHSSFSLYDLSGRIILNKDLGTDRETINVSDLSSGIYLYAVKSKGIAIKAGKLFID
jgi:hypothetical protein